MVDVCRQLGQFRAIRRVNLIDVKEQPGPFVREQAQEQAVQPSPVHLAFGRQLRGHDEAYDDPPLLLRFVLGWAQQGGLADAPGVQAWMKPGVEFGVPSSDGEEQRSGGVDASPVLPRKCRGGDRLLRGDAPPSVPGR